jgi:Rrf2 family protein
MAANPASAATSLAEFDFPLRVSARTDYGIRALTEMAASGGGPVTAQRISHAQAIPLAYLLHILTDLRRAGLVRSHRGAGAGYELARPAMRITLAEVIGVIERDLSRRTLEEISYPGAAEPLKDVWLAVRSSIATVLGSVTLADVAGGTLPQAVQALAVGPYPPPPERASP